MKLRNFWFYALIVWSVIKFLEDWRYRMVKVSVDIFFCQISLISKKIVVASADVSSSGRVNFEKLIHFFNVQIFAMILKLPFKLL